MNQSSFKTVPISVVPRRAVVPDEDPLSSSIDLAVPRPLRVCFPVLLDGDLVLSSEHLGVSYLVALLRSRGAVCRIVEVSGSCQDDASAIDKVVEFAPDLIGFSLTTVIVSHATSFGNALKGRLPNVVILAGGPLATFLGPALMRNPNWSFLDALVRGEGDVPMLRFAEALHTSTGYEAVPNLTWRLNDGAVRENPSGAGVRDLDMLPEPARDQFEAHGNRLPYLRIATSRGCTARCTFCNAPHAGNHIVPGKGWRGSSPRRVVDEVERLYTKYRFNTFDFVDSTFEDPGGTARAKERVRQIAQGILDRKLRVYYNICMQAKNWTAEDQDLIDLLYRSGLEKVLIGVESGSDIGLQRWQKKSTVADNKRAIRLLWNTGVYVAFGFIAFHPWSTFEEIRQNNQFLREYMGHNLRRYTVRLELYPGAEAVTELRNDGLLDHDFDLNLNPLAYRFRDPRVAALSSSSALLYGDRYRDEVVIEKEPSVFKFETFEIVFHTFLSRVKRLHMDNQNGRAIIEELGAKADAIRGQMMQFNFELMSDLTDRAERECLTDDHVRQWRPRVEEFFSKRIEELRSLQLKAGLRFHRAGININAIQHAIVE